MTESAISSANLDPRRRRVLFRAWHRGMREMDILMGKFADSELAKLSESELDQFEALMDAPDPDIFKWMTDAADVPAEYQTPFLARLKAFHTHDEPIYG
ncbi:MAG: protein of unassigned function [Hyphomicrobiales bacterium]|jgi:antitoxin CptB|nr:protein of unassigned function [Hyphomicrobiales bacterium]